MALRLVMMGTGEFARPTFGALLQSPHSVLGLFTKPDRSGRGHHRHRNRLKEEAVANSVPVFQPEDVNQPPSLDDLRRLKPDLCVVAAYGQILSAELLSIPRWGALNVHASLLPKFRGAAPIVHAVLAGETQTGVTVFQIGPKLDAGPILGTVTTEIGKKETTGELEHRLAELAPSLVTGVIARLEAGTTEKQFQDASQVTRAPRLKKAHGAVDWSQSAEQIERHVRAMQPWPTAFTYLHRSDGKTLRLIVLDVEPVPLESTTQPPGTILEADTSRLLVQTGTCPVDIRKLQPEGKRAMTAEQFLRGRTVQPGDRFLSRESGDRA